MSRPLFKRTVPPERRKPLTPFPRDHAHWSKCPPSQRCYHCTTCGAPVWYDDMGFAHHCVDDSIGGVWERPW